MVSHVYQCWLPNLFHKELVFRSFRSWIGDVTEVFITNKCMQKHIIKFHKKRQLALLLHIWDGYKLILNGQILENSVSSESVLAEHLSFFAAAPCSSRNLIYITLIIRR